MYIYYPCSLVKIIYYYIFVPFFGVLCTLSSRSPWTTERGNPVLPVRGVWSFGPPRFPVKQQGSWLWRHCPPVGQTLALCFVMPWITSCRWPAAWMDPAGYPYSASMPSAGSRNVCCHLWLANITKASFHASLSIRIQSGCFLFTAGPWKFSQAAFLRRGAEVYSRWKLHQKCSQRRRSAATGGVGQSAAV